MQFRTMPGSNSKLSILGYGCMRLPTKFGGVIDKDKAGNVLAQEVNADIYLILTDVEHALINYGKPDEKPLGKI